MTEENTQLWFLIGMLSVGGAEQTLVDLANNIDTDQYEVTVWTIVDDGPLVAELNEDVHYRTLDAAGKWDFGVLLQFAQTARQERPDIVQSFLFFDNVLARLATVVTPKTTCITGVREVPDSRPLLRAFIDRLTLPLSDLVVSNSQAGAEHIVNHGAKEEQVAVVPNGRDVEKYAQGCASNELYESLSLDQDCPIVGTVSRLVERKGHYDLLDAWPAVLNTHSEAQLLLVGDGPERDALERYAEERGCSKSVIFAGQRDDIPALLDAMDVFVFPSHYEGLPGALLEAMCAGLPIVTTPVDGCSELVDDEKHGIHVPSQNSSALGKAVRELLDNEDRASTLGIAAQQRARNNYSINVMVDSFEALYEN
ncbi:glycosyltransferase [Natronoarchaeum mannanilyticum]|uniref:Glycosyltransferase family 4 protein n=1 Tax=Natronoarchaeum mannanilyticum TaxID=926360 RepID=A0AAV3T943_9EURY